MRPFNADCTLHVPADALKRAGDASSLDFSVQDTTHLDAPARTVFKRAFNPRHITWRPAISVVVRGELPDANARYTLRVCLRFHDGDDLRHGDLLNTVSLPVHAGAQSIDVPLTLI